MALQIVRYKKIGGGTSMAVQSFLIRPGVIEIVRCPCPLCRSGDGGDGKRNRRSGRPSAFIGCR